MFPETTPDVRLLPVLQKTRQVLIGPDGFSRLDPKGEPKVVHIDPEAELAEVAE